MDENKKWMASGKIGCVFAAMFAKAPEKVGWETVVSPESFSIPAGCMLLSLQFPGKTKAEVRAWAEANGFYSEDLGDNCEGLRRAIDGNVSWVQYFGPDSHVATRRAPVPELMMACKLPAKYYAKVGFKGVLHLAHASIGHLKARAADMLWESSFKNTERRLGYKPTLAEAAKTTFHAA